MSWAQGSETSRPILWLYGPAGAGKSAIAQTIAEKCDETGHLSASFFFSRTSPGRDDMNHLIPTLAYQLALLFPETRPFIARAVKQILLSLRVL